jgi:hypothetical protein
VSPAYTAEFMMPTARPMRSSGALDTARVRLAVIVPVNTPCSTRKTSSIPGVRARAMPASTRAPARLARRLMGLRP